MLKSCTLQVLTRPGRGGRGVAHARAGSTAPDRHFGDRAGKSVVVSNYFIQKLPYMASSFQNWKEAIDRRKSLVSNKGNY